MAQLKVLVFHCKVWNVYRIILAQIRNILDIFINIVRMLNV
jgi:hypothetical protein